MWQSVFDEMKDRGLVVLAVAMDQAEAARPWIEAAAPAYPCLIDSDHHLADLYNLVNVPQALWIDETGRVVRPPETAGSTDGFRVMNRATGAFPEAAVDERVRVKQAYFDALRDWAINGEQSAYVMDSAKATSRLAPIDPAIAEAHSRFRLGQFLLRRDAPGDASEARQHFDAAIALHPDSWNMWRQTAAKDPRGLASGDAFWARVDALGERPYYAPVKLDDQ